MCTLNYEPISFTARMGMVTAIQENGVCRSDRVSPLDSQRWLPAVMFGLFVAGYVGVEISLPRFPVASQFKVVPVEFHLWVALLGAVLGSAAAAGVYFCCSLVGVVRLAGRFSLTTIVGSISSVLVVGGTVLAALFIESSNAQPSVDRSLALETRPIILVASLCITPGLFAFMGLRLIGRSDKCWGESGNCRLRLLVRVRMEIRRLLSLLGALLTLLVITTGMRRRALLAFDEHLPIPPETVLLYGLVFAAMLGLFFLGANNAVDTRARQLLDEFAPLPDPADPTISERIARRNDLAGLIGLGDSWRTFENLVVVAAPLLTALIGSALAP